MFGLFKKPPPGATPWVCRLGWQVLTYQEDGRCLSLQIEPMQNGPCLVYVPGPAAWQAQAPDWARERRACILQRAQQMAWSRELHWIEDEDTRFCQPEVGELQFHPHGAARNIRAPSQGANN